MFDPDDPVIGHAVPASDRIVVDAERTRQRQDTACSLDGFLFSGLHEIFI